MNITKRRKITNIWVDKRKNKRAEETEGVAETPSTTVARDSVQVYHFTLEVAKKREIWGFPALEKI